MRSMVEAVEVEIGSDGVEVCKVVKAVVPCDVDQDPPIPTEYVDEYDMVTDLLCLPAACAIQKITQLHWSGCMLSSCLEARLCRTQLNLRIHYIIPASYHVGTHNFFALIVFLKRCHFQVAGTRLFS